MAASLIGVGWLQERRLVLSIVGLGTGLLTLVCSITESEPWLAEAMALSVFGIHSSWVY